MSLLTIAASPALNGLAVVSQYCFTAAICMLAVMTLVYLWYTIGAARLAK